MGRRLLLIFAFLAVFSGAVICHAKDGQVDLEKEHGKDLTIAPFIMRYKFLEQYSEEWKDSTYDERMDFLTQWYDDIDKDTKKIKEKREAEQKEEKEDSDAKKTEDRIKKDRARAATLAEREEAQAELEEKKAFAQAIKDREREIKDLRRGQHKCRQDGICM